MLLWQQCSSPWECCWPSTSPDRSTPMGPMPPLSLLRVLSPYLGFYRDFFNTQLADTVLIWVLCIPGSYLLVHYHAMTGYGKEKDN